MRVSVIVPTRDRHSLLSETVASVAAQTFPEIQLVIVDDGSSEPVEATARAAWPSHRDHRDLIVIRQAPTNANVARNVGIDASNGELIQFLDSDDLLAPRKLSAQVERLERCKDLDMAVCHEVFFRRTPHDTAVLWNVDWACTTFSPLDRWLSDEPLWGTPGPLWRRQVLSGALRWNNELSIWQDWEFHTRTMISGLNYARVREELVFIRQHPERSYSITSAQRRLKNQLKAIAAVLSYANDIGCNLASYQCQLLERVICEKRLPFIAQIPSPANRRELTIQAADLILKLSHGKKRRLAAMLLLWSAKLGLFRLMYPYYRRAIYLCPAPPSTWHKVLLMN